MGCSMNRRLPGKTSVAALKSRKHSERQYTRAPLASRTSMNSMSLFWYTLNLRPWETLFTLADTIG